MGKYQTLVNKRGYDFHENEPRKAKSNLKLIKIWNDNEGNDYSYLVNLCVEGNGNMCRIIKTIESLNLHI